MLKAINPLLSPDILWTIAAMGHGDTLAIVDRNYPAYRHPRVHTAAGTGIVQMVEAVVSLLPLDGDPEPELACMVPETDGSPLTIHQTVIEAASHSESSAITFKPLTRFEFYDEAQRSFAVIVTGETSFYACFMITKGVIGGP